MNSEERAATHLILCMGIFAAVSVTLSLFRFAGIITWGWGVILFPGAVPFTLLVGILFGNLIEKLDQWLGRKERNGNGKK